MRSFLGDIGTASVSASATATPTATMQAASSGLDPGFLLILCLVAIGGIAVGGMLAKARDARIGKRGGNGGTHSR